MATTKPKRSKTSAKRKKQQGTSAAVAARWPWKAEPNPYFELRKSRIQGNGAFAKIDIPKGTKIAEYTGQRITNRTADRRYDDTKMRRHHTFLFIVDDQTVVDGAVGGNESIYINHSCDPNCEAIIDRKRIFIHAKKRIRAGEELAYDYQYERTAEHDEEDEKFYRCRCGSPKCRGSILAPKQKS